MRKFMINVNGKSYEVEVEEIRDGVTAQQPAAAPVSPAAPKAEAPAQVAPKAEAPKAKPITAPAGAITVSAPMPGTILDVKVKEGDSVKKGDVLIILEAMKMENEIMAPQDGKVVSVAVSKGASVNSGDPMIVLQ
ncbi:biotin/lipoyl-containing protein [Mahella sp.]|uniref:biotin/lipoyl-containing protein n=1 Tax=Mahella sp. TaxID=2798721 RepID=UPI0025C6B06F|nr:biotin/lipoyl-containing protein [Mahella sp.]MBZ4665830.1 biotin/lipoyl attachment protein [Mahella sp.]MDK2903657.1 glutaconyl-CoA/methylmalonyl-CoA decarboxylase subunit gamma [Clostridiales bacterium]